MYALCLAYSEYNIHVTLQILLELETNCLAWTLVSHDFFHVLVFHTWLSVWDSQFCYRQWWFNIVRPNTTHAFTVCSIVEHKAPERT